MEIENLVSVIITTYRRPLDILKRAIDSAVNQTYSRREVIVVNDYPEDETLAASIKEMIASYNCMDLKYVSYEKNMGACYARNYGVSCSAGKYIAFLDDDDEWIDSKIEHQLKEMTNEDVALVYSPYIEDDIFHEGKVMVQGTATGNVVHELLRTNIIGGCSMALIRRSAFEDVGGFNEKLLASQDYDLWLRIAKKYQVAYVSIPLVKRFLMEDSISINPRKKMQGWEFMFKTYLGDYENDKDAYNYRLNSVAEQSFEFGLYKYGIKKWWKAIQMKPLCIDNAKSVIKGLGKNIRSKIVKRKNK